LTTSADVARVSAERIARHFSASRCLLAEIDKPSERATVFHDHSTDGSHSIAGFYALADFLTPAERASLAAGTPISIDDTSRAPRPPDAAANFAALKIGAIMHAPYRSNGRWKFVLSIIRAQQGPWRKDQLELLQELGERLYLRLERVRANESLRAAHDTFRHLVDRSPFGIYTIDADFRVMQVSDGGRKAFETVEPLIGRDFAEVVRAMWPEPFASEVIGRFRGTLETGQPFRAFSSGERRIDIAATESYDWMIERVTMPDGRPGVVCHFYDLSERQRHEEHVQLLMKEVNHRSKNMLSVVQAVARRTAATKPEDFIERFTQRIQSLSANQDLLVKNDWKALPLEDLARAQLDHFNDRASSRISLSGPVIGVSTAASQTISMALHELATNAAKYGALSCESGRVDITWNIQAGRGGEPTFAMSWIETGGPAVTEPSRRGFGSTVIDGMVRMSFAGDIVMDYPATGVEWRMTCPAGKVTDDKIVTRSGGMGGEAVVSAGDRPRVLVVEDEPLIALEISSTLLEAGFEVLGPANSVSHALDLLARDGCDFAVLDTSLGTETSEPVARQLRYRKTPFVMVSGFSMEQQPSSLQDAPLLSKPFPPGALVAEIKRRLDVD
jgi:two-component sensor histidine kinase